MRMSQGKPYPMDVAQEIVNTYYGNWGVSVRGLCRKLGIRNPRAIIQMLHGRTPYQSVRLPTAEYAKARRAYRGSMLSLAQVDEIRLRLGEGDTWARLRESMGVTDCQLRQIVARKIKPYQ